MQDSLQLVADERRRHIEIKGWTAEHDDQWTNNELAQAAVCYCMARQYNLGGIPCRWPFDDEFWKPTPDDRLRELTKAAALIVAEMDRIQRVSEQAPWREPILPDDWNKPVRFKQGITMPWKYGVLRGSSEDTFFVRENDTDIVFVTRHCEVQE